MNTLQDMPHQGRNIKRIREMLGIKQEHLAVSIGVTQQAVSLIEQKEVLDDTLLEKVSAALGVTDEAIKNLTEDSVMNIVSTTFNSHDNSTSIGYKSTFSFNPIDKIVELYERMLQIEREKNELVQKLNNR